jgi:hypothetical protein
MNKCQSRNIECPYALPEGSPLPCFATKEQCDKWDYNGKTDKKDDLYFRYQNDPTFHCIVDKLVDSILNNLCTFEDLEAALKVVDIRLREYKIRRLK